MCLFEIAELRSPFDADTDVHIYENIIRGHVTFSKLQGEVGETFKSNTRELICSLLERDQTKRFGNMSAGATQVPPPPPLI